MAKRKLTDAQMREIAERMRDGRGTWDGLARYFKVSPTVIRNAVENFSK